MKMSLRSLMFKIWYWYISKVDSKAEVTFMNYGYDDSTKKVPLDKCDESNRYSIQLYHRLASAVDLKDKNIVEIGCGRGGGLAYIAKTFSPTNSLGIDLENRAVDFANSYHKENGLKFKQGDALKIPIESNSFDVVLNVESSHRYLDMRQFVSEVSRVLKHNGYFLYTDFRYPEEIPELKEILNSFDLKLIEEQKINSNVVMALNKDSERRVNLVKKLSPKFLHKSAQNFAGVVNTATYNQILSEELVYFVYIFQKNGQN